MVAPLDPRITNAVLGSTPQLSTTKPKSKQAEFTARMWPHAVRVSQRTGVDPRIVVAQAAQETGWGDHAPNNNFFGVKSHGKVGGSNQSTTEFVGGQPVSVTDSFRSYGDIGESADDYGDFLQSNPRYSKMLAASGIDAQLAELGNSGYATDPNYAQSVGGIAHNIDPSTGEYLGPTPTIGDGTGGQPESYAMLANSPYRFDATSPVLSSMNAPVGALADTNAEPEPTTFWGKLDRFAKGGNASGANSDKLLAIGAGLLSGENWREGIAAAGQGLADVGQRARAEDLARDELASQDAYRRASLEQRDQPRDPAYMQQAGVMVLSDGSPVETVFDPNTGAIMYHDGQGFRRVPLDATPANNSDVSGGKYTKTAEDLRGKVLETGITLGAIDGTMDLLERVKEDKNYGIGGLVSDVSLMGKTLFAQDPDVQELIRRGATSEIAGLIGRMREGVVGPGAPSNFDMAQVLVAVGGDLSLLSSPDAMMDQLTRIGSRLQDQYNNDFDQLDAITTQYPQLPVVKPQRTKLKDRAARSNSSVGAGPTTSTTTGTTKSGVNWSIE